MASILILYSTVDGHTAKICRRIQQTLEGGGHRVELAPVAEPPADLKRFDKIVIGASIRYGKHRPNVADFIRANQTTLDERPNAFFSVNVVARKPDKNRPETNPYYQKFIRRLDWRPTHAAVFAGKIDYPKYGFVDRTMIRLIMWMTKGPTDPEAVVEFTDWDQVDAFAEAIDRMG